MYPVSAVIVNVTNSFSSTASTADVAENPVPPQALAAGVPEVVPIPLPLVNPPITKLSAVVDAVKGLTP